MHVYSFVLHYISVSLRQYFESHFGIVSITAA